MYVGKIYGENAGRECHLSQQSNLRIFNKGLATGNHDHLTAAQLPLITNFFFPPANPALFVVLREGFERFHFQKPVFNGSNGYRRRENLGVANLCKQITKGNVMGIVGTTHFSDFFIL